MRKLLTLVAFLVASVFALFFLLLTAAVVLDCLKHHRFEGDDAMYFVLAIVGLAVTAKGAAEMWLRLGRGTPSS